jgi:L-fuculose-phosphate aldolase
MQDFREQLIAYGTRLMAHGLTAGTGGNISAREGTAVVVSASGVALDELEDGGLCALDLASGDQLGQGEGSATPTSESAMHLAVYRQRADVNAVVHAHPPWLSGLISTDVPFRPLVSEVIFYLGRVVTLPYVTPTSTALAQAVGGVMDEADTVLLPNHGILTTGATVREAYHRCVVAEHAAQAIVAASAVGRPRYLSDDQVAELNQMVNKGETQP